uniref:Pseudouridine-5'-monophosphatase n=1 Tax=Tetraselmis sp. GSL018 TaxID=582737 RepID=A0A061SEW7_9CHLO
MDGLLLETESFYTVVQQDIVGTYGKQFTWELKARMMGKKALEAAQILIDELELGDKLTAAEFLRMREERLDELFPTAELMPGAARLIKHLHSHGIPIAVATSSHKRHFDMKTSLHRDLSSLTTLSQGTR